MEKESRQFNRKFFSSDKRISYIGGGSPGGKAQGLDFINEILSSEFNAADFPEIDVKVPRCVVLRTDIFDEFMERNDLYKTALSDASDDRIAHAFQKADLPFSVLGDLQAIVNEVHSPLAVRSSSRLEDAMYEPFAGIYATKMTPNNQYDADTRFRKLIEAVKFVYASTFFKSAKDYIKATKHKIEDEKMAVIIQEVVGKRHAERYYPELSGVARSYNFYPMGRAKAQDGVVNLALGLGKTIVDGGISWTYSPAYPKINPPYGSVGEMLKQTQNEFWAVNMGKPPAYNPLKETEYMIKGNLSHAEEDGALKYIVSTLDRHSGRVTIGTGADGPRILTFAPLLMFNDIPLNSLIKSLLKLCEKKLNAPVEIEFAVTFSQNEPHYFGFLQVRPMVVSSEVVQIDEQELTAKNVLLSSERVLGNGYNDTIRDIVYVVPEKFEARLTPKIALELEAINKKLITENRPYLLIGFGRWGSSDPWLGIPVNWGQISGAKVIVEAGLEKMNVELSQGSHFFHNLTSFNVSYFSLPFGGDYKIKWEWLNRQKIEDETANVRHIRIESPLIVKVNGHEGYGVILIYK
jgi:hypothetical protein